MATAVQIDTTNDGEWAAEYSNFTQGPFLIGTTLYAMLTTGAAIEMFKSTDGGLTWTLQDGAHEPTGSGISGACFFDQIHTLWVAHVTGTAALTISSFNTGSDTWTTGIATGPTVSKVYGCCLRSDSTLFVCSNGSVPTSLEADIFDTLTLAFTTTGIDLATDITTLPEYSAGACGAFNPVFAPGGPTPATTSDIFCGYMSTDSRGVSAQMQNGVYFVGFNLANTTFNFYVAPNQIGNPQPSPAYRCGNGPFMGPPAVCGAGNIVFPIAAVDTAGGNYATIFVSNNFGATWTFDNAPNGADPGVTPSAFDSAQFAPMASWDGANVTLVYAQLRNFIFPSPSIRQSVAAPNFAANPNTWVWTASTALQITAVPGQVSGVNGFSFPKFTTQGAKGLLSTDISGGGGLTAWFIPISFGAGGRIHGTFVGFAVAGQFGGGTP